MGKQIKSNKWHKSLRLWRRNLRFNPCLPLHHTPFCLTVKSRNCQNTERTNQPKNLYFSSMQVLHLIPFPDTALAPRSPFKLPISSHNPLPALSASSFNHFPFPQCFRSPDDFLLASKRHLNLFSQPIQHNKLPGIKLAIKGLIDLFLQGLN